MEARGAVSSEGTHRGTRTEFEAHVYGFPRLLSPLILLLSTGRRSCAATSPEQHDNAIAHDFPMFSQSVSSADFVGELSD